jgi:hypothetical protein
MMSCNSSLVIPLDAKTLFRKCSSIIDLGLMVDSFNPVYEMAATLGIGD